MELRPGAAEDEWLTVALETDPRAMAELGGPWPVERTRETHARRIAGVQAGSNWWFTIVPDSAIGPVGSIDEKRPSSGSASAR